MDLSGTMTAGLLVGMAATLVLMRVTQSLLFGVTAADPFVIGTAMGVFVAAALIAGGLPARRAAALDPMSALRHE
jgi:ABC-type antimicrobial peptide transport system permease subunit